MKDHKQWKRTLAFTFALAVTAGTLSGNAAGLLKKSTLTAAAAEADEPSEELVLEEEDTSEAEQSEDEDASPEGAVSEEAAFIDESSSDGPEADEAVTTTGEDSEAKDKAVRTVMLYICGSNLERNDGSATYNLRQILNSDFGKNEDVNFVVMTGGTMKWQTESELLYDPATGTSPEGISTVYNQIWEAKSISDKEHPGQLVLLDGDGVSGDGENAKESADELITDPETLKAFINYTAENFPAEKYDLILWDHGGGPNGGFGGDDHAKSNDGMDFAELIDAFSDNAVTKDGGKFDFIDFDACVMSSLDLALAFADYTDYYIASPELEQGYGQYYTGWLNAIGENADIDTYDLGRLIVDDMISFYDTEGSPGCGLPATLSVINTKKLLESDLISAMNDFTDIMAQELEKPNKDGEYYFYDKFFAWATSINYGDDGENYFDLGTVMSILSTNFISLVDGNDTSAYTEVASRVNAVLSDPEVIYGRGTENVSTKEPVFYEDADGRYATADLGTSGIYLPAVMPQLKSETNKYFAALDAALEKMNDGAAKSFLEHYGSVLSDYALICETGYAVSALSDIGVEKSDITYDMLIDFWHEGVIPEGAADSVVWQEVSLYLEKHKGGEEAVREWLEPYINQMKNEVISPEKVSVQIVQGADKNTFIVNTEDTHKRLIDSVSLTYTAELPVVEEYWENSPYKKYRHILCPDLVLGRREAEVQISPEDGNNDFDSFLSWFENMSSTWEIDSVNDKWYAIKDADGTLHVAIKESEEKGIIDVPAYAYDADDDLEALVGLCFRDGDLVYIEVYGSDLRNPIKCPVSEITSKVEIMPIYLDLDSGLDLRIPLSKSSFTLSADNADKIRLTYTDAVNIPDIEDIDGDGRSITESLVITDMYDYSFDISDKLLAPAGTLKSIADAEVKPAVYNGTELRPVIVYNGKVLTEGSDYTIYNNNPEDTFAAPGTYSITVYGKGEYGGSLEELFYIYEADDFAAPAEFAEMSKKDFQQKTGIEVNADAVRRSDGTVAVVLSDDENIVDVYTLDAKTGKGTNYAGEEVDLPQTGMSGAHKAVTGLAALMLLSGAALIRRSRKEYEE